MPTVRCALCNYLCNPELFGCSEPQPCPKGRVCYCGELCQSEDAEKHRAKFHSRVNPPVVCRHFLRGHCAYGDKCWKVHPTKTTSSAKNKKEDGQGQLKTRGGGFLPPQEGGGQVQTDIITNSPPQQQPQQRDRESSGETPKTVDASASVGSEGESTIFSTIMKMLDGSNKSTTDEEEPKMVDIAEEDDGCAAVPVSAGDDQDYCDVEDDNDDDDSTARPTFSKKSRLEMKREARKNKKAARKRDKLHRNGSSVKEDVVMEEPEYQDVQTTEESESTKLPEAERMEDEEAAENNRETRDERAFVDSGASSPECFEIDSDSRRLTKKEKKREERRLQSIMKKKEKHESKLRHASMEYSKSKDRVHILMQEKKHVEAAVELTKLSALNNRDHELYAWRRDCYMALGKMRKATEDADQTMRLMPTKDGLTTLCHLQLITGETAAASKTLQDLGADAPEGEKMLLIEIESGFCKITDALNGEDWVRALDLTVRLESICSHSNQLVLMKAEAQLHMHYYHDATSILNRRQHDLKNDKHYEYVKSLHSYYTSPWWKQQQPDEVSEKGLLRSFSDACSLFPRASKVHQRTREMLKNYRTIQVFVRTGHMEVAKQMLRSCLALDPNNLYFMADLHCLLASLHDSDDERLKDLTQSLRLQETYLAYFERANVFRSKYRFEEALSDYESALKLKPDCPTARRSMEQTQRSVNAAHSHELRNVRNDLYAILGVAKHGVSTEDIKKAYRQKAKEFHPDKHANVSDEARAETEGKMKAVNKAYRVLMDPRQREIYDRQRRRSASSDVDLDFSDDDYECYDSCDDEVMGDGQMDSRESFASLFSRYFMQKMAADAAASDTPHGASSPKPSSPFTYYGKKT